MLDILEPIEFIDFYAKQSKEHNQAICDINFYNKLDKKHMLFGSVVLRQYYNYFTSYIIQLMFPEILFVKQISSRNNNEVKRVADFLIKKEMYTSGGISYYQKFEYSN